MATAVWNHRGDAIVVGVGAARPPRGRRRSFSRADHVVDRRTGRGAARRDPAARHRLERLRLVARRRDDLRDRAPLGDRQPRVDDRRRHRCATAIAAIGGTDGSRVVHRVERVARWPLPRVCQRRGRRVRPADDARPRGPACRRCLTSHLPWGRTNPSRWTANAWRSWSTSPRGMRCMSSISCAATRSRCRDCRRSRGRVASRASASRPSATRSRSPSRRHAVPATLYAVDLTTQQCTAWSRAEVAGLDTTDWR